MHHHYKIIICFLYFFKINFYNINSYLSVRRFSLSSAGNPARSGGVSTGIKSEPNTFDHLGTQTSVNVGVFDNEIKP